MFLVINSEVIIRKSDVRYVRVLFDKLHFRDERGDLITSIKPTELDLEDAIVKVAHELNKPTLSKFDL